MAIWGKRRGLSPLPAFGRSKFDAETRRVFDQLQQAARTADGEAATVADIPVLTVPVVEAIAQPRRRTTPSSARLGRILETSATGSDGLTYSVVKSAPSKRTLKRVALGGRFVVRVTPMKHGHTVPGTAVTDKSPVKGVVHTSGERTIHAPHQAERT